MSSRPATNGQTATSIALVDRRIELVDFAVKLERRPAGPGNGTKQIPGGHYEQVRHQVSRPAQHPGGPLGGQPGENRQPARRGVGRLATRGGADLKAGGGEQTVE